MNRGSAAWIPGGLLAPIARRLGIEYNIGLGIQGMLLRYFRAVAEAV